MFVGWLVFFERVCFSFLFPPFGTPSLSPSPRTGQGDRRGEGSEAPLISEPFYNSQLWALKSQPDSSGILLPRLTMRRGDGQRECVWPISSNMKL